MTTVERRRLRDLEGRERTFAICLFLLILVPFVVALGRAFADHWVPSGDEANIASRALAVFSRHPPLTGLPSTSDSYGTNIHTNHPGPIEFYLLALPIRLLGTSAGPLFTAAFVNAGCCVVAVWVFFRRLGTTAMLWAGALVLAVIWSVGTAVLTDTLSSNMPLFSLLGTATLVWAILDGDHRVLPLTAVVASYAAQQHLAAGLIVFALMLVALAAIVIPPIVARRRDDATGTAIPLRWVTAAVIGAAACWAPVAYDEVTGHPGNLTAIIRFARDDTRQTVGLKAGIYQVLHAVGPPTALTHTDTVGLYFVHSPGIVTTVLGLLTIAALVALLAFAWKTRRVPTSIARLAFVGLVLVVAGVVDGSGVPFGVESWRINLYRWTWAAAFITWSAIGIGAAALLGRAFAERPLVRRAQKHGPVVLLVVSALIATAIVFVRGPDDHNREFPAFRAERSLSAAVLARVDHDRPLVVAEDGYAANSTVGPAVVFRLLEAGINVEVSKAKTTVYGTQHRYRPRSNPAAIVITSTEPSPNTSLPGELIMQLTLSVERTFLIDDLKESARGTKITVAPGATALLDRLYPEYPGVGHFVVDALRKNTQKNFRIWLEQPYFLRLSLAGMLRSPALDRTKVERLLALLPDHNTLGGEEHIQIRYFTPDEVRNTKLPGFP